MIEKLIKAYQEAQLRVQLQIEEFVMTIHEESLQETSKSEMQGVVRVAIALQSEMSQEFTGCVFWKVEVMRRTKEVVEQRTKMTTGWNSLHDSSEKKLILHYRRRHLQEVIPWNTLHRLLLFVRPRDLLPMKVLQTGKKQRHSNKIFWPRASKFGSWKVSFRREVMSGSFHPRLFRFGHWYGILDFSGVHIRQAPRRVRHSGFQRLQKESWRLFQPNSSARSVDQRKLHTNTNTQCCRAGKPCVTYVRSRGYTMNVSDVLDVELYNDRLKMFNQVLGGKITSHWGWMIWMNMTRRICVNDKWTSLHAWRVLWRCTSKTPHCSEKKPRSYPKSRTMINDISEQRQQNTLRSPKGALKRHEQQHILRKALKRNARIVDLGHQKKFVFERRERKDNAKDMDHREPRWKRQFRSKTVYPRDTEKSIRKRRSCSVFQLQRMKWFRNAPTSVTIHETIEKDCPCVHPQKKKRSTSLPRKEKENQQPPTNERHRLQLCILQIIQESSGNLTFQGAPIW